MREAAELTESPSPDYTATPLDDNLYEWHFTLRGPPGAGPSPSPSDPSQASSSSTPAGVFSQGIYHGRIVLPPAYPLRPPSFRFFTPSGRFECNREICLSISGHHEETWQPAWGIRTALVALRTFMETDAKGQIGGLDSTDEVRRSLASDSRSWRCPTCGKTNQDIIKGCEEATQDAQKRGEEIKEDTVPDELKLGYKDEMGSSQKESEEDKSTSAELAEGFVQTAPPAEALSQVQQPAPYQQARPGQGVPQPTAPIRPAQAILQGENIQAQRSNDGVPAWLDKMIAIVVALLAFLVLKWILMS